MSLAEPCAICFAESIPMTTILSRAPDREETRRLCKGAGLSVVENLGENFGVLVLLVEGRAVEVAAYRKEVYGTDGAPP